MTPLTPERPALRIEVGESDGGPGAGNYTRCGIPNCFLARGRIETFAGSGHSEFNGEAGPALEMNLGNIVNMAFGRNGALLLIDGSKQGMVLDGTLRATPQPAPYPMVHLGRLSGSSFNTSLIDLLDAVMPLGAFKSASVLTRITNSATASIGGESAEVVFAGGAPGQIGGLCQMNIRIPKGLASGAQPLQIRVADSPAKPVIIYVR